MYAHLKKLDWSLIVSTLLLSGVGLLTIYSIKTPESLFIFKKQFCFLVMGILAMFTISFMDYRIFKNYSSILVILYLISLLFLILVLFVGKIRGASSWFRLGPINFEPIELAKIILILFLAKYFSFRHIELYRIRHLIISGIYIGVPTAMVLLQPDFGSAIVLCAIWFGLVVISGIKFRHLLILFLIGMILFTAGWFSLLKEYQKQRILSFLDPQNDPYGSGYHISQSLIAVGSGGIFGLKSEIASQAELKFLPEQFTDFIFAAWAEQRGLIGVFLLLILFAIMFWRIIKIALKSSNNFSRLFTAGLAIMLITQVIINAGMNMGILPITGLTLPLVSYGGSSLVSTFIGLGILQSIKARS